jgi:peptidoglycan hydrolase CwlO-like protein
MQLNNIHKIFILIMFSAVLLFANNTVSAIIATQERIEKCQEKTIKTKKSPGSVSEAELEKCERTLQSALTQIKPRKNILSSQVKLYNLKVNKAARDLNDVEKKVKRNELELKKIEETLEDKNKKIEQVKTQLKKNIVLYEQNKQNFKLNLLDANKDLVALMNKSNYLNKIAEEINNKLKSLQEEKQIAEKKQEEVKIAREEVKKNKEELKKEKARLETQRRVKNDFLQETKGDEIKYKTLLTRIEKQKQQILSLSSLSVATKGSIAEIKKNAPKPKDGLASTSWYYDQGDPRWGHKTIGFSKTLMKDYGCAVTALAMVFTEGGEKIKPGKLAKKPLFYRDLIVWPNSWGKLQLKSGRSHGNISWSTIDKQLKKKKTAIVFIRSRSGAGHYVVIHHKDKKGRYVVHDPLFGANMFLETSKKLVSSVYKSGVTVDQMLLYK